MIDIKSIQLEVKNNLRKNLLINGSFLIILCMFFFALVDGTLAGIKKTFDLVNSNFFQVWENWLLVGLDLFVISYCLHVFVKLIKVLKSELFIYKDEKEYIETIKKAMARTTYPWGNISIYLLGLFVLYNILTIIIYAIFEKVSPLNEQLLENGFVNILSLLPLIVLFCLVIPINNAFNLLVKESSVYLNSKSITYKINLAIEPVFMQYSAIIVSIALLSILGIMKKESVLFYEFYEGQKLYLNSNDLKKDLSFTDEVFFSSREEKKAHNNTYSIQQSKMLNILDMKQISCNGYFKDLDLVSDYRNAISFKDAHNLHFLIIKAKIGYIERYRTKKYQFSISKDFKESLEKFLENDTICESPVIEKEKVKK